MKKLLFLIILLSTGFTFTQDENAQAYNQLKYIGIDISDSQRRIIHLQERIKESQDEIVKKPNNTEYHTKRIENSEKEIAELKVRIETKKNECNTISYTPPSDASLDQFSTKGKKIKSYKIVTSVGTDSILIDAKFHIGVIAICEDGTEIKTSDFGGKNDLFHNYELKMVNIASPNKKDFQLFKTPLLNGYIAKIQIIDKMHPQNNATIEIPISFAKSYVNDDLNNPIITASIANLGKSNHYLVTKRYDESLKKVLYEVHFHSHFGHIEHYILEEGQTITFNIGSKIFDLDYDTRNFVIVKSKFDWSKVIKFNLLDNQESRLRWMFSRWDPNLDIQTGKSSYMKIENHFEEYKEYK